MLPTNYLFTNQAYYIYKQDLALNNWWRQTSSKQEKVDCLLHVLVDIIDLQSKVGQSVEMTQSMFYCS